MSKHDFAHKYLQTSQEDEKKKKNMKHTEIQSQKILAIVVVMFCIKYVLEK